LSIRETIAATAGDGFRFSLNPFYKATTRLL